MSMVWPIGGISPELRRGIIRAANGAGLTVEAWLEQTISRLLLRGPGGPAAVASQNQAFPIPTQVAGGDVPALVAAIDRCLERLHPAADMAGAGADGAKVLTFVGREGRGGFEA